ncbi:MAG: hypothetical protein PHW64_00870 [Sulfuricurvum sp.]|nr:hypothetical protein [Sulfuricurvum sp.]
MVKKTVCSLVCAGGLFAGDTEVEQLKQQMEALQRQVSQMQQHLNIEKVHPSKGNEEEEILESPAKEHSAHAEHVPDIEIVLNGGFTARNVSNVQFASAVIPGYGEMEIQNNSKRGFNFNYAEVAMNASVGSYLDAGALFHVRGDGAMEIEEANFITKTLDYGLRFKAGKFKSAFGQVNEKHHHAWNFEDQELINAVFFGPEALGGEGAQLQWTVPIPIYLKAGLELFNGNSNQGFSAKESASTVVGYLKTRSDFGDSTLLSGVNYARGKSQVQNVDSAGDLIADSFTTYGNTQIYGVDLTLAYPLGEYGTLVWQNEWMQRNKDMGTLTQKQSGYYSELLYTFDQNWAAGIRYDSLNKNSAGLPDNLNRTTLKLEYEPFEHSRFRFQYNQDHSKIIGTELKTVHEVLLNYTIELGAHDTHTF